MNDLRTAPLPADGAPRPGKYALCRVQGAAESLAGHALVAYWMVYRDRAALEQHLLDASKETEKLRAAFADVDAWLAADAERLGIVPPPMAWQEPPAPEPPEETIKRVERAEASAAACRQLIHDAIDDRDGDVPREVLCLAAAIEEGERALSCVSDAEGIARHCVDSAGNSGAACYATEAKFKEAAQAIAIAAEAIGRAVASAEADARHWLDDNPDPSPDPDHEREGREDMARRDAEAEGETA